jgi:DNA invertase Pin-like site-specific DNA recombinase
MSQNIFIYARVSTDAQSHDSQLTELRSYCQRRGWESVQEITDVVSGTTRSRSGLDRLMKMVRAGKVDVGVAVERRYAQTPRQARTTGKGGASPVRVSLPFSLR